MNIITDGYSENSVATIWNVLISNTGVVSVRSGLVEVSHDEIKVTLVGFDNDIYILTGASTASIDLINYYLISHVNKTSLLQRSANSLISTSQDHYFGISVYNVAYHYYSGKKCIHSGHQEILINLDKDLMDMDLVYVPIW